MILKQALSLIAVAAMAVCSQSQAQLVEIYSDNFDDETNTGWTYLDRSAGTALVPDTGGGPGSPSFSETGGLLQQTVENYSFPDGAASFFVPHEPMLGGIALSGAGVVGDETSATYRISVQFDSLEDGNRFQDHTVVFAYVDEDNFLAVETLASNGPPSVYFEFGPVISWYQVVDGARFIRGGVNVTFTHDPYNMVINVDTVAGTLDIDYNDGETIADIGGMAFSELTIPAGQIGVGSNNDAFAVDNFVVEAMAADVGTPLKGDVDMSGTVDFGDIGSFIAVLQSGVFQAEADCNCDLAVDFADISAFIAILQGQ